MRIISGYLKGKKIDQASNKFSILKIGMTEKEVEDIVGDSRYRKKYKYGYAQL